MNPTRVLPLLLVIAISSCHPAAVRTDSVESGEPPLSLTSVTIPSAWDLTAIDTAAASIAAGAWSIAHEQVSVIDRRFWGLIEALGEKRLAGRGDLADRLRDRTWQHLQDRLAAADAPGLAKEQAVLLASSLALSARCQATGQKLPAGYSEGVSWWQRRFQKRWRSDDYLAGVTERRARGDLLGAWEKMELAAAECPDGQLDEARRALLEQLAGEVSAEFERAVGGGDATALLGPLRQLVRLGASPPKIPGHPGDVRGWRLWCQRKLQQQVARDIAKGASGRALLTLVKLVDLGVAGVQQQVEILRTRLQRIPLPRLQGAISPPAGGLLLLEFNPVFTQTQPEAGSGALANSRGERGKIWRRSPGHAADVQRWGKCLEELLLLNHDWWLAPGVKAPHLRQRQIFQVRRLLRLATRLEENQPRRWQTLWGGGDENSSRSEGVRIVARKRLLLIDSSGAERTFNIVEEALLRPLPNASAISREQRDVSLQRLTWRLGGRVERLLEELCAEQLVIAMARSQRRAKEGDENGAIEQLVSTLITAQTPRDGELIRDGVALLGSWTGLTEASIRRALLLYRAES